MDREPKVAEVEQPQPLLLPLPALPQQPLPLLLLPARDPPGGRAHVRGVGALPQDAVQPLAVAPQVPALGVLDDEGLAAAAPPAVVGGGAGVGGEGGGGGGAGCWNREGGG